MRGVKYRKVQYIPGCAGCGCVESGHELRHCVYAGIQLTGSRGTVGGIEG